jgi:hypothetical protein
LDAFSMSLETSSKSSVGDILWSRFPNQYWKSLEAMIGLRQDCIESSRAFEIEIKDVASKISSKQNKAQAQDQEKIAPSAHHVETQIKIT